MVGFPRVRYIRPTVSDPRIVVGEYSYYDDPDPQADFIRQVLYHYPFSTDRLVIGKFCAIATGVKFIMNGANHLMDAFSTYPFYIFGNGWEAGMPAPEAFPNKGDTVIGHDVWIGYEALIMPGVQIGNGAIIAASSVVTGPIPAYCIAGGNPARVIRPRFAPEVIAALERLAWWHWEPAKITRHLRAIMATDIAALQAAEYDPG
jgi:virginiamycin A acetyltransferase